MLVHVQKQRDIFASACCFYVTTPMLLCAQHSPKRCVWYSESIKDNINMKNNLFSSGKKKNCCMLLFLFSSRSTQRSRSQITYPSGIEQITKSKRTDWQCFFFYLVFSPHKEAWSSHPETDDSIKGGCTSSCRLCLRCWLMRVILGP